MESFDDVPAPHSMPGGNQGEKNRNYLAWVFGLEVSRGRCTHS